MAQESTTHHWKLVDTISTLFSQAYMLARARAASHPSPIVRLLAGRDHADLEAKLLEREATVLRAQRKAMEAHRRPHYGPEQRVEIIQVMSLRGWSVQKAADRFVVHPNTLRSWKKAASGEGRADSLLGSAPWNKLHDGVRWVVHQLRQLCPEKEFGTRTIARHILRAGVQISGTSVRRILKEEPPEMPKDQQSEPDSEPVPGPEHLLKPGKPNRVWHLDLTSVQFLWVHLRIVGMIDGFSRKLLTLRVYDLAPTTEDVLRLVDRAIRREGKPRFLVTDHGCQFWDSFEEAMKRRGVKHVRGKAYSSRLNMKVERVFRTLKLWQRLSLMALNLNLIQKKLTAYRLWYNRHRPHSALGLLTPDEAAGGCKIAKPKPVRARGTVDPSIQVERQNFGGDPRLPVMSIKVKLLKRAA